MALIQQQVAGPQALPDQVQARKVQVQAPEQIHVQQPGDYQVHQATGQPQAQSVKVPQVSGLKHTSRVIVLLILKQP